MKNIYHIDSDEQWSFVEKKSNQRWLWHAVDHATNIVKFFRSIFWVFCLPISCSLVSKFRS
jgi:hypothetical protein